MTGAATGRRGRMTLSELTEAADVSVRTVRYYIAEGLLPPPAGAGPHSAYSQGHLDRLRLIQRLKERYLPLKEIRRRLAGLEDDEVRSLLDAEVDASREAVLEKSLWEPSLADARTYLQMLDEREPYRTEPLPFQGPAAEAAVAPRSASPRPASPAAGHRARRVCSRPAARRRTRCPISVRSCGGASPWAKKWSSSSPSVSTRVTANASTGSCAGRARFSTDATPSFSPRSWDPTDVVFTASARERMSGKEQHAMTDSNGGSRANGSEGDVRGDRPRSKLAGSALSPRRTAGRRRCWCASWRRRRSRPSRRAPIDVAFVLDRSGSMSGGKLDLAKEGVDLAVARLRDADRDGAGRLRR